MTVDVDDDLWSAIADPSRRRVLDLLVQTGGATASALAADVPFTRQAVSKHLVTLEQAGLVRSRKLGREVRYELQPERLVEATQTLVLVARDWDRRLHAIKRLAEATHQREKQA